MHFFCLYFNKPSNEMRFSYFIVLLLVMIAIVGEAHRISKQTADTVGLVCVRWSFFFMSFEKACFKHESCSHNSRISDHSILSFQMHRKKRLHRHLFGSLPIPTRSYNWR
jgi:hypothetical protein